jgi:hypothetical protein
MKKSTVIATCLKNSGSHHALRDIEISIEQTFQEDFPGMNYKQWNTELSDQDAQGIIKDFGSSYSIDVRRLIIDMM